MSNDPELRMVELTAREAALVHQVLRYAARRCDNELESSGAGGLQELAVTWLREDLTFLIPRFADPQQ